ncbi:unnamed protein product [Lactuca saligna]|uniref:NADP-dependent oxidoreductase domain-containing protein n=1 Tax=Lactuca saligna TaxID=75948 RepID=A0AA35Y2Z6_LACSI|nr:unnamed protein product [Lactuca saligna]
MKKWWSLVIEGKRMRSIDLYYQHRIDTRVPIEITNLPRFLPENLENNKMLYERVSAIAVKKGCTPSQLALAWVHHQGKDVVPIPGTTKIENLQQNIGALSVKLTPQDMAELESPLASMTQVYALTRERDTLRREQNKRSDATALLKEKDDIITQVMEEGENLSKKQVVQESTIRKLWHREFEEEKKGFISKLQAEENKVENLKSKKAATEKLLQETIEKNQSEVAIQKEYYLNALSVAKEAKAVAEARAYFGAGLSGVLAWCVRVGRNQPNAPGVSGTFHLYFLCIQGLVQCFSCVCSKGDQLIKSNLLNNNILLKQVSNQIKGDL